VRLADPVWLILMVAMPLPWLWPRLRSRIAWPTLAGFDKAPRGAAGWLSGVRSLCLSAAIGCLAVAVARPQAVGGTTRVASRGVSIVIAIDHSQSMTRADFPGPDGPTSRLAAAQETLGRFIDGRPDDLIGLVVFANFPDLACPPTVQHDLVADRLRAIEPAAPGENATNIGDAIAWAADALRQSPTKRKVLILATDGRNNPAVPDPLDPIVAARLARELGIVVHAIAIGRAGGVTRLAEPETGLPVSVEREGPDLELLARLAAEGGGRSFQAADRDGLATIFATIDALEKSPVQGLVTTRYRERFTPWAGAALGLLIFERRLAVGRLRRLP